MNDGFEVSLGFVDMALVSSQKHALMNLLNRLCDDVDIKNILPKKKTNREVVLWVTLTDQVKALHKHFFASLFKFQEAIKSHSEQYWDGAVEKECINISKVDFCTDLIGSFLPEAHGPTYAKMKSLVQGAVNDMVADPSLDLWPRRSGDGLKVIKGDNILQTCYQYVVTDQDGDKLMTIKFYDKL